MKAFTAMVRAGITMLRRDRTLLITSLGLPLISIFVFGWLFGSSGAQKLALGVVDEDHSTATAQLVTQLQRTGALNVSAGTREAELRALREGHRGSVLVLDAGFGAALAQGHAAVRVYYDQSSPIVAATARMAVQSIVAGLNQQASGQAPLVSISEEAISARDLRQIDWLTPGMLGMLLMYANLNVGGQLVQWRKQGIMRRLAVTPLRPSVLIASQVLSRLVLSLAQGAALIAVAMVVFQVRVTGSWAALVAAVALGSLAMLALGFVVGSFAKDAAVAQAAFFLISFPMMFLSGSYFPTEGAPAFLTPVIKALPLTYLNDALRQVITTGANFAIIQSDLLVLLAWLIVATLLAARAFRWS
ncbi:MAG: ABC transporter permease [Ktedonobacterales bacterium]|nr:ABC transporter permease [Ktedonobacterales bacterium]